MRWHAGARLTAPLLHHSTPLTWLTACFIPCLSFFSKQHQDRKSGSIMSHISFSAISNTLSLSPQDFPHVITEAIRRHFFYNPWCFGITHIPYNTIKCHWSRYSPSFRTNTLFFFYSVIHTGLNGTTLYIPALHTRVYWKSFPVTQKMWFDRDAVIAYKAFTAQSGNFPRRPNSPLTIPLHFLPFLPYVLLRNPEYCETKLNLNRPLPHPSAIMGLLTHLPVLFQAANCSSKAQ